MTSRHIARALATALFLLPALAASAQLTLTLQPDNSTIHYSVTPVTPPDTSYCVTSLVIDGQWANADGNAPPCTTTPAIHGDITCLTLGAHTIGAIAYNPSLQVFQIAPPQTVTVSAVPSFCTNLIGGHLNFDISDRDAAADREVLLSNTHLGPAGVPDTPYPHYQAFLSKDKQIPVDLRIIYNGAQTSGVTVTMSVIDPPDPSPYVAGGQGIVQPVPGSHPGDNVGGLAKLTGADVTDNGNGTYTVTSGANGAIETVLQLDATARAGDNYRVVATASFPDGSVVTATSGMITAWKRVFLEKRQMFKRGSLLASDAPAGLSHVIVPDEAISSASTTDAFVKGHSILLVHAPLFGQPKTPGGFYQNIYTISGTISKFTASAPTPGPCAAKVTTCSVNTDGTSGLLGVQTDFTKLHVDDVIDIPSAAPAGYDIRIVQSIADKTHLTLYTPVTTTATGLSYQVGDRNLIPGKKYRNLPLDRPLTESYSTDPIRFLDQRPDLTLLNDGVVDLAAGSVGTSDYFDTIDDNIFGGAGYQWTNAFPSAYTEYVVLPASSPFRGVPRVLFATEGSDVTTLKYTWRFVEKWFDTPIPGVSYGYSSPDNQQVLLIGDGLVDSSGNILPREFGVTSGFQGSFIASILARGTVDTAVKTNTSPLNGADLTRTLHKIEAHELTHQWSPNEAAFPGYDDHCYPEVAYNSQTGYQVSPTSGTLYCMMSYADPNATMIAPWSTKKATIMINAVEYQYANGIMTFHVVPPSGQGQPWHSEYLMIRNASDPWRP